MTTVKIYGILAKKFGNTFKIKLGSLDTRSVISAIDSIRQNFRKTLLELNKEGFNYALEKIRDTLFILPYISGSGKVGLYIAAIVLIIIAIVLTILTMGTAAPAIWSTLWWIYTVGAIVASSAGSLLLQMAMAGKSNFGTQKGEVGGSTMASEARGKSYTFGSNMNMLTQGSNIPIGYGRMRSGSKTIVVSIKNYPTNISFSQESSPDLNNNISIYD